MTAASAAAERRALPDVDDWHTPDQLSGRVDRAAYTICEHLRGEVAPPLHGHKFGRRWLIRGSVGEAWRSGLDLDAQRRVCGCLAVAPAQRRRTSGGRGS